MISENKLPQDGKKSQRDECSDETFFLIRGVENCCFPHIKNTFETLLLNKKSKQQELADFLGLDKAYVSRMVNGLIVPTLRIRLKVAEFFKTDSALIWRLKNGSNDEK